LSQLLGRFLNRHELAVIVRFDPGDSQDPGIVAKATFLGWHLTEPGQLEPRQTGFARRPRGLDPIADIIEADPALALCPAFLVRKPGDHKVGYRRRPIVEIERFSLDVRGAIL
jgi:hypothetical protein